VVFGALFAVHGAQKLFGWFGGYGLSGTAAFLESIGFRPGRVFALADGLAEFSGGLLLAFGFLVPFATAAILSGMLVAIVAVHWGNGLLAISNGVELPLLYSTVALLVVIAGPGEYSLDVVLGFAHWWTPAVTAIVVGTGIVGAGGSLALRHVMRPVVHA
jgi:putative oxidoreductase